VTFLLLSRSYDDAFEFVLQFSTRFPSLSTMNIFRDSNGNTVDGKRWRNNYQFLNEFPFYSNIPRQDEIGRPLEKALLEVGREGFFAEMLLVR